MESEEDMGREKGREIMRMRMMRMESRKSGKRGRQGNEEDDGRGKWNLKKKGSETGRGMKRKMNGDK